jgi:hypothetical protein
MHILGSFYKLLWFINNALKASLATFHCISKENPPIVSWQVDGHG